MVSLSLFTRNFVTWCAKGIWPRILSPFMISSCDKTSVAIFPRGIKLLSRVTLLLTWISVEFDGSSEVVTGAESVVASSVELGNCVPLVLSTAMPASVGVTGLAVVVTFDVVVADGFAFGLLSRARLMLLPLGADAIVINFSSGGLLVVTLLPEGLVVVVLLPVYAVTVVLCAVGNSSVLVS